MNKTDVMSWIYFSHPQKADIVNILIIIAIWTVMVIVVILWVIFLLMMTGFMDWQ